MPPCISVVTAAFNAGSTIRGLYDSLAAQSHPRFQWVIADGGSKDGTIDALQEFARRSSWVRFISEPDSGIYHALNKAIRLADCDYYVVAGADDWFANDAMENFLKYAASSPDVVMARVRRRDRIVGGFHPCRRWIGPSRVFSSSHSVGTMIRKALHARFGEYSYRYPLLADAYFLKTLLRSGQVKFVDADFIAGTFSEGGATTREPLQLLAENWQIQMLTEPNPMLQTLLFVGKILRRFRAVRAQLRAEARTAR